MKVIKRNLLNKIKVCFFIFGMIACQSCLNAFASSGYVVHGVSEAKNPKTGVISRTPIVTINGRTAFCVDHEKGIPKTGDGSASVYDNAIVRKILYYGYDGVSDKYWKEKNVTNNDVRRNITSLALDNVFNHQGKNYRSWYLTKDFYGWILKQPDINDAFLDFDKHYPKTVKKNNQQITEVITVTGSSDIHYTLSVPRNITINNLTSKERGQQVLIKGGDKFTLNAPLDYEGKVHLKDIKTGRTYQSLLFVNRDKKQQNFAYSKGWIEDHKHSAFLQAEFTASKGFLAITKKDSETHKIISSPSRWGIYQDSKCTGKIGEIKTDQYGYGKSQELKAGVYYVKELEAPLGYMLKSDIMKVFIEAGKVTYLDSQQTANKPRKGHLHIKKSIPLIDNIYIDYRQIHFQLIAAKDIIRQDGSIVYHKGERIRFKDNRPSLEGKDYFTLNKQYQADVDNLWVGEYILKEVSTDSHLKVNSQDITVSFSHRKHIYDVSKTLVNYPTVLRISKKDTRGQRIKGAKMILYKDQNHNHVLDRYDLKVKEWISTGREQVLEGLEKADYILHEEYAPFGYKKAEDIVFTLKDKNIRIDMIDDYAYKDIILVKKDSHHRTILNKDFIFGLYTDKDCRHLLAFVHGNLKTGEVIFKKLKYGTYYIKELKAPEGYQISKDVRKIVINDQFKQQSIDIINKKKTPVQTGDRLSLEMMSMGILVLFSLLCIRRLEH